jgi:nicotinamidase-related amidase
MIQGLADTVVLPIDLQYYFYLTAALPHTRNKFLENMWDTTQFALRCAEACHTLFVFYENAPEARHRAIIEYYADHVPASVAFMKNKAQHDFKLYHPIEYDPANLKITRGSKQSDPFDIEVMDPLDARILDHKVVLKNHDSAFYDTHWGRQEWGLLHSYLKKNGIKNLVVFGAFWDLCVASTVADAVHYNYNVTVLTDRCLLRDGDTVAHAIHQQPLLSRAMPNKNVIQTTSQEWLKDHNLKL